MQDWIYPTFEIPDFFQSVPQKNTYGGHLEFLYDSR